MSDEIQKIVEEIAQLRSQYIAEVGEGRRKWPRSIKERAERLEELGVRAKQVSLKTGIGYETLLQWRFKRRQQLKRQFHEVEIGASEKAIVKVGTVTVPKSEHPKKTSKIGTVSVTTPDGYEITVPDAQSALQILKGLRTASCS
jgi:hypothetical protein